MSSFEGLISNAFFIFLQLQGFRQQTTDLLDTRLEVLCGGLETHEKHPTFDRAAGGGNRL